ncbi:carboxypeptidase-like regulatory domain-containing protein [Luteimonas sp. e5]
MPAGLLLAALLTGTATLTACARADASDPAAVQAASTPPAVAVEPITLEKGHVRGRVVDTRGQAIEGANILLDHSLFYAAYIRGTSEADGSYRIAVKPGPWDVHATFDRQYNGRIYTLDLEPDNAGNVNERGAIRNFAWKLEGRPSHDPDAHYGGLITVDAENLAEDEIDYVQLTLTPSGPLIDGSPGRTLKLEPGDHYWIRHERIEDVPIGRYLVSASLHMDGHSRPLKLRDRHADGEFLPRLQLDFLPHDDDGARNSAHLAISH